MITAKEALRISTSEDLSYDETSVYNKIIDYIDGLIKSGFNGLSVTIRLEGAYINAEPFRLSNKVPKAWRQEVVTNKWKSEYRKVGWKIEEKDTVINGIKIFNYVFSIDPAIERDEKITQILDK